MTNTTIANSSRFIYHLPARVDARQIETVGVVGPRPVNTIAQPGQLAEQPQYAIGDNRLRGRPRRLDHHCLEEVVEKLLVFADIDGDSVAQTDVVLPMQLVRADIVGVAVHIGRQKIPMLIAEIVQDRPFEQHPKRRHEKPQQTRDTSTVGFKSRRDDDGQTIGELHHPVFNQTEARRGMPGLQQLPPPRQSLQFVSYLRKFWLGDSHVVSPLLN